MIRLDYAENYNVKQAQALLESIKKIQERLNPKHTPTWLMLELDKLHYSALKNIAEWKWSTQ